MTRTQTARQDKSAAISSADCLEQQFYMVDMVCGISVRLARSRDFNAHINNALAEIGAFVGADRAYVFQFRETSGLVDNTHEWCAEGVLPQIGELQGLPSATFAWFMGKVHTGESFQISDVSRLPDDAEPERSLLEAQDIRSLLIMPFGPFGRPTGFVGFDNIREVGEWRSEHIKLLQIVSRLVGDTLERSRSYQALELSVQRQRAILENIPDIAWLKDEDSQFIYVNEPFARSCGVPAEKVIGKTDSSIWPKELAMRYQQDDMEVIRTHQRKTFEEPLFDKELGERLIETIKTPVFDDHGRVVGTTGIARDITARKQTEQKIRESEERYRRLVESLPAVVYRYCQSQGVSYWSPQVENILGYSQRDLLNNPFLWHDAIHPDDLPRVDQAISAFEVGEGIDLNYRIRDADGNWHWFHDRSIGRVDVGGTVLIEGIAFDITTQKRAEQELRENEQRYRGVVEDTPIMICRFLPEGEITFVNDAYCQYFERAADELIGSNFLRLIPESERGRFLRNINALTPDFSTRSQDYRIFTPDGEILWQRWTNRALFDKEGRIRAYQSIGEDITERKQAEQLVEHRANFDALTELPNRRLLVDRLLEALARCRRHGHIGALLFLDLDGFKHINDSLGHPVGDALLQEIAKRLKSALRQEDTAARMGGDEFVVLLTEVDDNSEMAAHGAREIAERIKTAISVPCNIDNHEFHITASVGIAMFPMGEKTADDIVGHADMAMYRAKEAGRNTIRFFHPSMQLAAEERLRIQSELRQAISRREWELYFQPQVGGTGTIIGAEALLRWIHPERGIVRPQKFIPLAEETGQIITIGEWVLNNALSRLKAWKSFIAGCPLNNLSVNVSARQIREADFVRQFERVLGTTGADPNLLTLELTEGVFLENLKDITEKIRALKSFGVRISIDDFGTGYSSLRYLKNLPLDEIKIDRSFVKDIATDPGNANLVATMIDMADNLGVKIVAEGVESAEQLAFLLKRGCMRFQGNHFDCPQPAEDFEEILRKRKKYSLFGASKGYKQRDV